MYEHYVPILIDIHRTTIRVNPLNMYDTCSANSCCELVRCMYVFMNKEKHELSSFVSFIALSLINTTDEFLYNDIVQSTISSKIT